MGVRTKSWTHIGPSKMNAVESSCRPHCTSGRRNLRFYYNHYTEKYYKNVKILHTELLGFLNIYIF